MSQLRLQQHDIGLYDTSCQLDQNSTMIVRQVINCDKYLIRNTHSYLIKKLIVI